jgi:hypothetical protein
MKNTALQLRETDTMAEWQTMRQQAETLVKTGFLPGSIKTPDQAVAIVLMGREIGVGMMVALNNINVIAGKPTISPQLMLALINRTGELEDMRIDDDGQCCSVAMRRRGRSIHSEAFSMKDAALMKTTEGYGENKKTISLAEKYNWRQMPAVMRKWRAIAACARVVFPDVILGMYTPEEMGADNLDVESGAVVEDSAQVEVYHDNYEPDAAPIETSDPRPKTLGELVTPKQLWTIRNLGRETGLNIDEECRTQYGVSLEEINKRAATELIDYLKSKSGESAGSARPQSANGEPKVTATEFWKSVRKWQVPEKESSDYAQAAINKEITWAEALNTLREMYG